jgi:hypothetical protein
MSSAKERYNKNLQILDQAILDLRIPNKGLIEDVLSASSDVQIAQTGSVFSSDDYVEVQECLERMVQLVEAMDLFDDYLREEMFKLNYKFKVKE